jgi:hypothetical protein
MPKTTRRTAFCWSGMRTLRRRGRPMRRMRMSVEVLKMHSVIS